jgi:CBS domain-containing protein
LEEDQYVARIVSELMNPELMGAALDEETEECLARIMVYGVSGAPVLDAGGRVCGVVSWRDLVGVAGPVKQHMSMPAVTVSPETAIEKAAVLMAESGLHRLVVVDDNSRPVGVLSTLDVIRGLIGLPAPHPAPFPHFDPETSLRWSDDLPVGKAALLETPDEPGILVLVHGGVGQAERVVWAEVCSSVRGRLSRMLNESENLPSYLREWLAAGTLRVRFAETHDAAKRMTALRNVLMKARESRKA